MADAMEMMVLSIISPVLMCDWNLSSPEEALITTVRFFPLLFVKKRIRWLRSTGSDKRKRMVNLKQKRKSYIKGYCIEVTSHQSLQMLY